MRAIYSAFLLSILLCCFVSCEPEPVFVDYRQDVDPTMIIDEDIVVGGELTFNQNSSRIVKTINLPVGTKYWIYWIGVGQESKIKYEESAAMISESARSVTTHPIIALGLEILTFLHTAANSANDNIDFYFTDRENADLFWKGGTISSMTSSIGLRPLITIASSK